MIKFVQSGDFHLDSPLEAFDDSVSRRLILLDSFGKVIDLVKESHADLLFLTGDIFDNDGIRAETLDYLSMKLREIPQAKVFITPGNHDFIGRNSVWIDRVWPDNVHIFSDFESVFLEDLGILVHGAGFRERIQPVTLLPELAALDHRWPNILVMHGDLVKSSSYNPLDLEALSRFDYCALGHRHEFQRLGPGGTIVYAGNPCARNFLETGQRGCVIGSLEAGELKISFSALDFPAFHDLTLDVSHVKTNAEVREMIKKIVLKASDYYRITLTGRNNIEHDTGYLQADIPAAGLEVVDSTRSLRDYDSLKEEPTLQGVFTRRMLELFESEPLAFDALEAGLDALEDETDQ